MKPDPTLARVREARHRISEKHDHDPKRLIEYYMELQKRHGERLVSSPRPESQNGPT
jgi:hypothetical protein